MINPLFLRYYFLTNPVEKLSYEQYEALERFRAKLGKGDYTFEQASCCLCTRQDGELIARRDRYALPVNTYLCRACGIMWTNPRMDEDSLRKFYEEDYRPIYVGHPNAPENFFTEQIRHGEAVYDFIASHIPLAEPWVVFDIGCGAGGMLIPFLKAGLHAYGCDVGEEYLQRGRKAGLVLEHGDAGVLQKYSPANLVILSHVLEHLPYPLKELKQISDLLVDGGYVYIELPGILSIHKTYGDTLLFLQNAHLYHFTLTTLAALMSKAGFRLVKGDEYIHALFQKDDSVPPASTSDQYGRIKMYLYFTELERISRRYPGVLEIRRLLVRMLRLVVGDSVVDGVKGRLSWLQI